jgi:glycyl-tRNA synthetase beta subunit
MKVDNPVDKNITNDDGTAGIVTSMAALVEMKSWLGPTALANQVARKRVAEADVGFFKAPMRPTVEEAVVAEEGKKEEEEKKGGKEKEDYDDDSDW